MSFGDLCCTGYICDIYLYLICNICRYIASIPENLEPGTVVTFPEQYATTVHDEDIGKAGVFALKLRNNNGTFEINPAVAERIANFIITIRDNALIDYEMHKSLSFKVYILNAKLIKEKIILFP